MALKLRILAVSEQKNFFGMMQEASAAFTQDLETGISVNFLSISQGALDCQATTGSPTTNVGSSSLSLRDADGNEVLGVHSGFTSRALLILGVSATSPGEVSGGNIHTKGYNLGSVSNGTLVCRVSGKSSSATFGHAISLDRIATTSVPTSQHIRRSMTGNGVSEYTFSWSVVDE